MNRLGLQIMYCQWDMLANVTTFMSQETHAGQWIAFRQPVRRVWHLERAGKEINYTYEANPGEVWEENEWWIEVIGSRMDPDGTMGIRQWFESPYREGEIITVS